MLVLWVFACLRFTDPTTVKVVRVEDGNTLEVSAANGDHYRIVLLGINDNFKASRLHSGIRILPPAAFPFKKFTGRTIFSADRELIDHVPTHHSDIAFSIPLH